MSLENKPPAKEYDSSKEFSRFVRMLVHFNPLFMVAVLAIFAGVLLPLLAPWRSKAVVVVYASQDEVYSEPLLQQLTKQTGIKVRAVYDSEAVKTVGLANRLLAERAHPQCDVFWNNEELLTRQLAGRDIFRQTNGWVALGCRSLRIVINTNHVTLASAPRSLVELTNQTWRGKVALAYPLFGTTATHFLALRQRWGEEKWLDWCRALQANKPFLVDGNSVVVKQVARGEAWLGLTDSDDIAAEQQDGLPVTALPITEETLLIPNTVAVVRGAPHPQAAEQLFEYLQQRQIVDQLIAAKALEGFSATESPCPVLQPDWASLLDLLQPTTEKLKGIFLR